MLAAPITPSSMAVMTDVPVTRPTKSSASHVVHVDRAIAVSTVMINGKAIGQDDEHAVHPDRAQLDPLAAQRVDHERDPPWYSCTDAVAFKNASSSEPVCGDSSCSVTL